LIRKEHQVPITAVSIAGRAKPGKRDELYALYAERVVPHVEHDDSIEALIWSADRDDPDSYVLFEIFADGAGPSAMQSDWFQEYMQLTSSLVAAPAEVRRLAPRWTKGI
jgi:quinol monooxygenase YgiN